MSSVEESQDPKAKDIEEINVFEKLLTYKDKVHKIVITVPFMLDQLAVHYMTLNSGEIDESQLPSNFDDFTPAEKVDFLLSATERKVWKMIEKANNNKETPEKYKINKEMWDEIKNNFPDVFEQIVGIISGRAMEAFQSFFSGQRNQE